MAVVVNIDGVARTSNVRFGTLRITDQLNHANDTCEFVVEEYGDQTFRPEVNEEVEIFVDAVKAYGGVIVEVDSGFDGDGTVRHEVKCKDYSHYLDRHLIIERYLDTDVQAIILDLIDRYADDYGFTGDGVEGADFEVTSISFNELTFTECLQKLATLTGYSWYVDFEKDIHFFKKNDEPAPFNLNEVTTGGVPGYDDAIYGSLEIRSDFSQIRNKVKIRGGEAIAEERTVLLAGNGETEIFGTEHKFSAKPTVEVDGVEVTVGLDYLEKDEDYDVMWNFTQKYIRFTDGNIPGFPAGDTNISITGLPLKPIVVQVYDTQSMAKYGVYEFKKYNDSIKTRDEALQFAHAELQAYAESIRAGKFQTYTPGLRSGHTITITNTKLDVSESFLIQRVVFQQVNVDTYLFTVEIATLKTISIIDVLQRLIYDERLVEGEDETLLNFIQNSDSFNFTDEVGDITVTDNRDYVYEQGNPGSDTYPNPIRWNMFTWD